MNRDLRIDILRVLAILLIILAHVSPPEIIFNLRIFDVVLMVLLVGMSYSLSTNRNGSYVKYIFKRFKRLIIPAWIFVSLFIVFIEVVKLFSGINFPYTLFTYISSYFLFSGVGYVWIIRIFFILALFLPFINKFSEKVKLIRHRIILILLFIILQDFIIQIIGFWNNPIQLILHEFISQTIGYLIVGLCGLWAIQQNFKQNLLFGIFFFLIFLSLEVSSGFPAMSLYKNPPSGLYLSYGISVSFILLALVSKTNFLGLFQENKFSQMINWVSQHSLEIYYWHVFPVTIFRFAYSEVNWSIKYITVIIIAVLLTAIQLRFFPKLFTNPFKK